MKNDPHLLVAETPAIIQGRTISVLCGKEILNAQPTPVWDEVIMGRPLDLQGTRICEKCKKAYAVLPPAESGTVIRVYAILPGGSDA